MKKVIFFLVTSLALSSCRNVDSSLTDSSAFQERIPTETFSTSTEAPETKILPQDMQSVPESSPTSAPQSASTREQNSISETEAKQIALQHAGLLEENVTFVKIELDEEYGKTIYELEFLNASIKYEYDIDKSTGEILKYSQERWNEFGKSPEESQKPQTSNSYVGEEKALIIASQHAAVSVDQIQKTGVKLDEDDGRMIYEVEFWIGTTEYEYEIDAIDGSIIKWEKE